MFGSTAGTRGWAINTLLATLLWESMTPLGKPVVPDV